MFLVHKMPVSREAPGGSWVEAPDGDDRYLEGSDDALMQLRRKLRLNGETAFADTVAAFAALPAPEQEAMERAQLRKRLN